jgi:ATP-dependent Clp protease protease subunit
LFLESADASKDIQIYLNSPGGSVYRIGIYDTMQYIKPDVANLYRNGGFYGTVLLCAGAAGKRSALLQEYDSSHQEEQGVALDMEINYAKC